MLLCDWLGRNKLIITWAVRHLAIATFGNDRWRHDLLQLQLDVVYLDIYLFFLSVCTAMSTKAVNQLLFALCVFVCHMLYSHCVLGSAEALVR